MLNQQFVVGTLFVALVVICVTGVTWISSTLIDVDKNIAVMSVQTEQNSKKIDELHVMLKPMWEEFTGRSFENNAVYKK